MKKTIVYIILTITISYFLLLNKTFAQTGNQKQNSTTLTMSLDEVISTAKEQSLVALVAKHNFIVQYWQFRSYKAQFLPSLNLGADLGQYNRSLVAVQNSETGGYNYVVNDNLRNSVSLSVDQNIALTGGKVSLYTSLLRLDQFSPNNNITYNSQPVNIAYSQPLFTYNSLKWEKKIEPKRFEMAKRTYLENMEDVTITAVNLFFELLTTQNQIEIAKKGYTNSKQSFEFAKERFKIGSVSKDQLLELELRILNDEISIRDKEVQHKNTMMKLRNFLGYNESVNIELVTPQPVQDIELNYDNVIDNVNQNSSFTLQNEIDIIESDQDIARAKANRGITAEIYAQFGLTQVNEKLSQVYKSPLDQEIVGLSLKVPIVDWGLGKGRVKVAKSKKKVIELQREQSQNAKREEVLLKVMQFNLQGEQCSISQKADIIGKERYQITRERFENGAIPVRDLNTAQTEMDNATSRYISDLASYWKYYYQIQQLSLFNYIKNEKISEDFEKLTGDNLLKENN